MFEKLQALKERTASDRPKPPKVASLEDITSLVSQLAPADKQPDVQISTVMTVKSTPQDGPQKWLVRANTASRTRRDVIINGLTQVKNAMSLAEASGASESAVAVNGRPMKPARVPGCVERFEVDEVIELWLGAKRDGVDIVWSLPDGHVYRYDAFRHKLTRGRK